MAEQDNSDKRFTGRDSVCLVRDLFYQKPKGGASWEVAMACVVVLGMILAGVFLLKLSYKSCLNKGYSLTECVFNQSYRDAPAEKKTAQKN